MTVHAAYKLKQILKVLTMKLCRMLMTVLSSNRTLLLTIKPCALSAIVQQIRYILLLTSIVPFSHLLHGVNLIKSLNGVATPTHRWMDTVSRGAQITSGLRNWLNVLVTIFRHVVCPNFRQGVKKNVSQDSTYGETEQRFQSTGASWKKREKVVMVLFYCL